jgi:hypothetical protein
LLNPEHVLRDIEELKLEFRIPISPTAGFYSQVRVFDYALRRLGPPYNHARINVYVGDDCDIEEVRRANAWSGPHVEWGAVPREIVDEFGIHGTADWRLIPPSRDADLIILSDADTILLRDINPLLMAMPEDRPAIRGHMAHMPPPSLGGELPHPSSKGYWPGLFTLFGAPWPDRLFAYSMDDTGQFPQIPAYFNLGFVALNPAGLSALGLHIFDFQREFSRVIECNMRCQIALSLIAYTQQIDIDALPATYNTANDLKHLECNYVSVEDIRVLHYLRTEEIDRSTIFQDEFIRAFVAQDLANPVNRALQAFAKIYSSGS